MSAWGIGLWQDDVWADLVAMFDDLIAGGSTATEAVARIAVDPPWGWDDEDDTVAQVLALAALALQRGVLDPDLRDRALALIESGAPLKRWTAYVGAEMVAARAQLLGRFDALLRRGTATAEELASVTEPEAFSN